MTKKQTQIPEELRSPSPEFQQASEVMGFHWWHWNNEERRLSVAPALMKILGYSEEQYDPSVPTIDKNIHPDDVTENLKRFRQVLNGETNLYEMEYRIRDKKGEWQWYYNRGAVMARDEHGKVLVIGGISMDISGQYKRLLALVEEKEKFEFIFRNTNEAILVIELENDRIGRVLDANKAALELFERNPGDFLGRIPEKHADDPVMGQRGELFKQVIDRGFGRVEQRFTIGKDKVRWLEITAHSFTLTGENLIIAIANDRTEGRETEAALRESERLYQSLFEAADDAIGLYTLDMEMILANSAFHENFGYTREEFLARAPMGIVHPEDQKLLVELLPAVLKEGNMTVDFRIVCKSGEIRHVSSKNVIIPSEKGEPDMVLTILRDMTERRKAMEELKRAKEKAEESDQLKSAFLANMSHEIRTPMNSIVGFSNLLVNPGLNEEAKALYVNRIVRNSELLLALISDIIDLAKIESGQLPIIYGKVKLSVLIAEIRQYALDELDRMGKKGIQIIMDEKESECEIETDVIRLIQIMKNLVNNAIKFTDKGSITIGCERKREEDISILFVKDTGIGIAPENLTLIFDQFRQVDGSNTRKYGGTGLGLAICKNLLDLMGGRIRVESEEGRGALFQVELPMAVTGKLDPSREAGSVDEVFQANIPGLLILVVDDEQDSLDLFNELLTGIGHQVISASTGFETLRLLEKPPRPRVIFMDVQMPVLTGSETMKIVKDRYPEIKVVAQSAHALVGDRARFLGEGFDAYLPKPFTEKQLSVVLSQLFPQG